MKIDPVIVRDRQNHPVAVVLPIDQFEFLNENLKSDDYETLHISLVQSIREQLKNGTLVGFDDVARDSKASLRVIRQAADIASMDEEALSDFNEKLLSWTLAKQLSKRGNSDQRRVVLQARKAAAGAWTNRLRLNRYRQAVRDELQKAR